MKTSFIRGFMAGILAMAILGGAVYGVSTVYKSKIDDWSQAEESDDESQMTVDEKMNYLKAYIDNFFMFDVDGESMTEGIYKGMFEALGDPYSTYYTAEEYIDLMESQSGEYCGIGVVVQQDTETGIITIVQAYEDSPASEVGIVAEDVIYKVKGEEVTGVELEQVVSKIKGEEGTTINITIYRSSTDEYIDLEVERRIIEIKTIDYEMLEDGIGYIAISQFDMNTDEQFEAAMEDLLSQGMEAVVFDVRSNPGGIYDTVCNMLDYLLPKGVLVYTLDKNNIRDEETSDAEFTDIPMVVLINGNSASASEIFAGAIQDFEAGTIIGTQSFGKGIVQSVMPLSDGSAIKLTISKYFTPKGQDIHQKGITPDVEVELPEDLSEDTQLDKALEILKEQ